MDFIVSVILVRKAQKADAAAANQLRGKKRAAETTSELRLMLTYADILRSPGPLPLNRFGEWQI